MIINTTTKQVICKTHEVADTHWKRAVGLMFRKELPKDHGLLMVFDQPCRPGIWMFGMRFPIDIIFLDSEKKVIHTVKNARPLGLKWKSWRVYYPPSQAKYVLEINGGTQQKNELKLGTQIIF
jgi:uncharacterized membrane protein (UPF0127 family)